MSEHSRIPNLFTVTDSNILIQVRALRVKLEMFQTGYLGLDPTRRATECPSSLGEGPVMSPAFLIIPGD